LGPTQGPRRGSLWPYNGIEGKVMVGTHKELTQIRASPSNLSGRAVRKVLPGQKEEEGH
jgi:hypothetical protein